jgi:hypothetical protein
LLSALLICMTFHQSPPEPNPGNPVVIATPPVTFPYPVEEPLEWQWTQKGVPTGKTIVQWRMPTAPAEEWTIDARLQWRQPGRTMQISQRTRFLQSNLRSQGTHRESWVGAAGAGEKRIVVASEVDPETAQIRIVVQDPARATRIDRFLPFHDKMVLLENQAFEHWLLIGLQLERTDQRQFTALIPSEYRSFELELKKDRAEKIGPVETTRWSVLCREFEAKIWIGPGGTIEQYRQGELEIRRVQRDPPDSTIPDATDRSTPANGVEKGSEKKTDPKPGSDRS